MALIDIRTQEELHQLLLNLLGKSAYATDPGTNKSDELLAWAKLLAHGDERTWTAFKQAFASMADEMLDEIERDMLLPNDRVRTVDERRARILGVIRARLGASPDNVELALEQIAPSARVETITRREVTDAGVQEEMMVAGKIQVTPDEWTDVVARNGARFVSRRLLPAASVGDHHSKREDHAIFVERDARWGSLHKFFDRDAILAREFGFTNRYRWVAPDDARSDDRENACTAHLRTYGPLSLLVSEDINRLQRAVLPSACIGADADEWPSSIGDGAQAEFFSRSAASGGTVVLAEAINEMVPDHRDRILYIAAVYSTSAILPGGAADNAYHAATQVQAIGYIDPAGGLTYEIYTQTGSTLRFESDASGNLLLRNTTGSTVNMVGVAFLGPKKGRSAIDQRVGVNANSHLVEFNKYESLVRLSTRFWKLMQVHGQPSLARTSTLTAGEAWNGHGPSAVRVAVFTIQRPTSGQKRVVLDGSRSWLDRYLAIQTLTIDNATRIDFPGSQGDVDFKKSNQRIYYTRTGLTSGATEAGGAFKVVLGGTSTCVLYADQDTGALVVERSSSDPEADPICGMLMIWASPQLGQYPAVEEKNARVIDAGFSTGDPVSPRVLNLFQENSVMSQGHASHVDVSEEFPGLSYDNTLISTIAGNSEGIGTFPLGMSGMGSDRRPMYQLVRSLEVTEHQQTNGQIMRSFSVRTFGSALLSNGEWKTWIVDDQNDWRDRFIHVGLKTSQQDIRPSGGNDANAGEISVNQEQYIGGFYSGPGVNVVGSAYATTASVPYSDNFSQSTPMASFDRIFHVTTDGKLAVSVLKDVDTAVHYLVGFVFASPQMGPRTSPWTSPRVQPESSGPGVMVDDLPARLQNVELRSWFNAESGVMIIGDRVLSVTDQGGGEAHMKHVAATLSEETPEFLALSEDGFEETAGAARPRDILGISGIKIGRTASFGGGTDTGIQSELSDVLEGEVLATLCVFLVRNANAAVGGGNAIFGYGRPSGASSWVAFPGANPQACELMVTSVGQVNPYMCFNTHLQDGQCLSVSNLAIGTPTMVLASFRRNVITNQVRLWFNNVDVTSAQVDEPQTGAFGKSHVYLGRNAQTISGQGAGASPEMTIWDAMIFAGDATVGGAMDIARLYDFMRWKLNQGVSAWEAFAVARPNRTRWYSGGVDASLVFPSTRTSLVSNLQNRAIGASTLAEVSGGANGFAIKVPIDNRVYDKYAWIRFRKSIIAYQATSNDLNLTGDLYATLIFRATPGAGKMTTAASVAIVNTSAANEFVIGVKAPSQGSPNLIPFVTYNGQSVPITDDAKFYVVDDGKPLAIEFHHKASTGATFVYINGELAGSAVLVTIPATNNSNVRIGTTADTQWDFGDFYVSREDALALTTVRAHLVETARRYFMPEVR